MLHSNFGFKMIHIGIAIDDTMGTRVAIVEVCRSILLSVDNRKDHHDQQQVAAATK